MTKFIAKFKVTGVDIRGRRFKAIYTNNRLHALGINLYCGHVWEWGDDGKWHKIKEVWN
jgi:hypothetical protein